MNENINDLYEQAKKDAHRLATQEMQDLENALNEAHETPARITYEITTSGRYRVQYNGHEIWAGNDVFAFHAFTSGLWSFIMYTDPRLSNGLLNSALERLGKEIREEEKNEVTR